MARSTRNRDGAENASENNNQQTIILGLYLHCEECVKPVIKCLEAFRGVEEVNANFTNHNLTIKGQKDIDPKKIAERLEKKCNKQVQIIAPKLKNQNAIKEEKKAEPKIVQVTLNMYVHCENCGNNIKQRIQNMTGVQKVEVNVAKSQVVVKGELEPQKLVEYVNKRMGKAASIEKTENLQRENGRQRRGETESNNNNNNNNNNNSNGGGSIQHVPFFDGHNPQQMEFLYYSDQMFIDDNTQACIIV